MVGRIQRDGRVQEVKHSFLKCKVKAGPLIQCPKRLCQHLSKLRVCWALRLRFRSSSTLNTILPKRFSIWMQTQARVAGDLCSLCLCSRRQPCCGLQEGFFGCTWAHGLFFLSRIQVWWWVFNQQNDFPWNHRFFYHEYLGKYYSVHV